MNRQKILLVDDDGSNSELLRLIFEKDYEVITACDGNEALLRVENDLPDLILLDILMPGLDGYEICRLLKDKDKTMFIPIIMVTALMEKKDRIMAIEAGADDFLTKPIDMDILCTKVKSLLRVKRYYDNLIDANREKSEFVKNRDQKPPVPPNSSDQEIVDISHPLLKMNPHIEGIVKNHLEIIILEMLSKEPLCGYDIIKQIFSKYNVFLSQGTVYPVLYSLKRDNILQVEFAKGNMRTKKYSVTKDGKPTIEKRLNEFITAEEYILKSIRRG